MLIEQEYYASLAYKYTMTSGSEYEIRTSKLRLDMSDERDSSAGTPG
jgi:hypothetical protein